jgi:hypothetical protein
MLKCRSASIQFLPRIQCFLETRAPKVFCRILRRFQPSLERELAAPETQLKRPQLRRPYTKGFIGTIQLAATVRTPFSKVTCLGSLA